MWPTTTSLPPRGCFRATGSTLPPPSGRSFTSPTTPSPTPPSPPPSPPPPPPPLREAVAAPNGATGGQVMQKMLPQSCNGAGRPLNQKLGAIDTLTYTSTANPLAEMMFNTAWYMGGQQASWWFGTGSSAAMAVGKSGPCSGCNADFEVIFSPARRDVAHPAATPPPPPPPPHPTRSPPPATSR